MLLATLRMTPDDKLTKFFSENGNAPLLSRTMKLICSLLRDVKLEADFPIAAVAERRAFFAEQQRMVVDRSMTYVLTLIKHYETEYLADAARFSSSSRLVWRFHGELMDKMKCIRDLIKTIGLVDPPGFVAVLRRYRVCMQRVYAMEMNRFFKQLRARIKKVGPRGPFLLGVRDAPGDTLAYRAENASEESPTGRWEYTPTSVAHSTPANFSFSRSFSVRGGESAAGWTSGIRDQLDDEVLSVDLVNAEDERLRLYNPAHMQTEGDALLTSISVASAFSGKKGKLRPDVALAVALETTFTVILREEDVLCRCFGLAVVDGEKGDRDKEADVGRAGRPSGGSETGFASMFVGDDVTMKCSNTMGLLNESLLELFGGDKLVRFPSKIPSSPSLVGGGENECSRNDATPKTSDRTRGADSNFEANEGPFNAHRCGLRKAQEQCDVRKQLVGLAEYFGEKCDRLYAVPVMAMVQAYRREDTQIGSSSFCQALLQVLEEVMASIISRSMAEQNASVLSCRRRYLVLPTGILTCFTKLPTFVQRMEIVHNDLSPAISRGEYASFGRKLVDLSFESLKCITNLSSGEGNEGVKLSTMENVARCTNRIFNKSEKSIKSLKHIFLQNYRHHAFFCAFYASLDPSCYAVEFLSERYSSSCELRDHYRELYLTRVVFRKKFPVFSHFVLVSEELAQMHSPDQLQHHSMLSKDKVQEVLQSLPEEMQSGIPSSSKKMKKHFLRDVAERKNEVSFHCELLQSVWKDFCTMLLQKFDFLEGILRWPVYAGMRTTLTRQRVMELLQSV
ncbi:hypothetical protein TRVL_06992 [Trypanosoma vivax]|nr:hypothetical protein TRVL_06992 [Trypanosoma vivax]